MTDSPNGASDGDAGADLSARTQRPARDEEPDALSRLAGAIGHEFRNLLMIIQNYAEFIREGLPATSELHEDLAELVEAANRGARLTDDLVAFGRGGASGTRSVELASIVAAVAPDLRGLLADDVELRIEIAPGLAPVEADGQRLRQVLEKVVRAVGKGRTGGATICIAATEQEVEAASVVEGDVVAPGRYVLLIVGDDGVAFGLAERTFGRALSPTGGGHGGLGLAMVHGIVEAWGGALDVRSGEGPDTVVRLLLPCAVQATDESEAPDSPEAPHAPDGADALPAAGGGARVLVCEDERAIRTMCERALRAAGFEVLLAEDGDAGIRRLVEEQAAGRHLDLLVSDIVMPGSSGFELADAAREHYPDVSIVLMTAFSEELASRAPPSGTLLLEKPFPASLLVRRARALAGG